MESENQCEMAYITDLPECVWQMIGLVLSLRPVSFGSAAVAGFDICIVFLDAVRCGKKPLCRLCVDCDECKLQAFLQGLVFAVEDLSVRSRREHAARTLARAS